MTALKMFKYPLYVQLPIRRAPSHFDDAMVHDQDQIKQHQIAFYNSHLKPAPAGYSIVHYLYPRPMNAAGNQRSLCPRFEYRNTIIRLFVT